jgi:arsenate reductase
MKLDVQILITENCPHASSVIETTQNVLGSLVPGISPSVVTIAGPDEAVELGFPGSPTVRVNGVDLEGAKAPPPTLACRSYGSEGTPPTWLVEAAVVRALEPRHVLFLCVANSARSQMAEGIARSLAREGVRVSSAGSEPTQIRPEAVKVLEEIGIDPTGQGSSGMDEVDPGVDAVFTLCAEEVCPAWLGQALRVHWGLPDPASVKGSGEERLQAFRKVRDELRRRLQVLFA